MGHFDQVTGRRWRKARVCDIACEFPTADLETERSSATLTSAIDRPTPPLNE